MFDVKVTGTISDGTRQCLAHIRDDTSGTVHRCTNERVKKRRYCSAHNQTYKSDVLRIECDRLIEGWREVKHLSPQSVIREALQNV